MNRKIVLNEIEILLDDVIDIALEAGRVIMGIYNDNSFQIDLKNDNTPLTLADIESHRIISEGLKKITKHIKIISEESEERPVKSDSVFWMIDPLDGTKEFISRNGEFTVNIALIQNNIPVFGMIYAPAINVFKELNSADIFSDDKCGLLFWGAENYGSFFFDGNTHKKIECDPDISRGIIAVSSKSHSSPEEKNILANYSIKKNISIGSSLKFCMIASGLAHIYYRLGPTYEWDTAAGDAIARYSGAHVEGLVYNKNNLLNGSFSVKSFI